MESSWQKKELEEVEFDDDTVFTWPTLVVKEFLAALFVLVGLLFFSFFVNSSELLTFVSGRMRI